jgi:hypothetical protein
VSTFSEEMDEHAGRVTAWLYGRGDQHEAAARSMWALVGYYEGHKSPAARDVMAERARQDVKWGEQNHDPFVYGAILGEEVGEFLQAALKCRFEAGVDWPRFARAMREEAVQCAAVALAIVECLDRGKWTWGGHALPREEAPVSAPEGATS